MQIGRIFWKAEIGLMIFKNAGGVLENRPISMTKRSRLIMYGEIMSVKCKNDMKFINTFCFMQKYEVQKYIVSCEKKNVI